MDPPDMRGPSYNRGRYHRSQTGNESNGKHQHQHDSGIHEVLPLLFTINHRTCIEAHLLPRASQENGSGCDRARSIAGKGQRSFSHSFNCRRKGNGERATRLRRQAGSAVVALGVIAAVGSSDGNFADHGGADADIGQRNGLLARYAHGHAPEVKRTGRKTVGGADAAQWNGLRAVRGVVGNAQDCCPCAALGWLRRDLHYAVGAGHNRARAGISEGEVSRARASEGNAGEVESRSPRVGDEDALIWRKGRQCLRRKAKARGRNGYADCSGRADPSQAHVLGTSTADDRQRSGPRSRRCRGEGHCDVARSCISGRQHAIEPWRNLEISRGRGVTHGYGRASGLNHVDALRLALRAHDLRRKAQRPGGDCGCGTAGLNHDIGSVAGWSCNVKLAVVVKVRHGHVPPKKSSVVLARAISNRCLQGSVSVPGKDLDISGYKSFLVVRCNIELPISVKISHRKGSKLGIHKRAAVLDRGQKSSILLVEKNVDGRVVYAYINNGYVRIAIPIQVANSYGIR